MRIEFNQAGTFQAMYAAEAWCRENGISVGQSCAVGPTGLLFGQYDWIAKWRNLTARERKDLHGTMSGDMRDGPVVIVLKDEAVRLYCPSLLAANCLADAPAHVEKSGIQLILSEQGIEESAGKT